jgi:hypothetical protein
VNSQTMAVSMRQSVACGTVDAATTGRAAVNAGGCYPGVTPNVEKWSGRPDSNRRPPAPKAGALPGCATPRLQRFLILLRFPTACSFAIFAFLAKTVPKLWQNSHSPSRVSPNPRGLVRRAVQLLQRPALHLQLHLRIFLEHLRVPLPKELRHPFVGDASCTETNRVRRTQIIDDRSSRTADRVSSCQRPVSAASFAACAVCFSFRAMFRVCHDFDSVFGFGFSFLCDSRLGGVVVDAMHSSFSSICQTRG